MFVGLFVSNKRQNGWTDRAEIFFLKIRKFFCMFLFYNVYKEKMCTIEIENGHEAPLKPSIKYFGKVRNQQKFNLIPYSRL